MKVDSCFCSCGNPLVYVEFITERTHILFKWENIVRILNKKMNLREYVQILKVKNKD